MSFMNNLSPLRQMGSAGVKAMLEGKGSSAGRRATLITAPETPPAASLINTKNLYGAG